jgi:hypothetical protein
MHHRAVTLGQLGERRLAAVGGKRGKQFAIGLVNSLGHGWTRTCYPYRFHLWRAMYHESVALFGFDPAKPARS